MEAVGVSQNRFNVPRVPIFNLVTLLSNDDIMIRNLRRRYFVRFPALDRRKQRLTIL